LVAASPFQVFASVEARMYAMGTALAAASGWLLLRNLREGAGIGGWAAYALTAAGLPPTHHYRLFPVLSQVPFPALYGVWLAGLGLAGEAARRLAPAAAAGAAIILAYAPALVLLSGQVQRVRKDYWIRPLSWETFFATFSQFVVPDDDYEALPGGAA